MKIESLTLCALCSFSLMNVNAADFNINKGILTVNCVSVPSDTGNIFYSATLKLSSASVKKPVSFEFELVDISNTAPSQTPDAHFDPATGKVYISDATVGGIYIGAFSLEMIPSNSSKFITHDNLLISRKVDVDSAIVTLPTSNEGINIQGMSDLGDKLGLSINQGDEGISLNIEVK